MLYLCTVKNENAMFNTKETYVIAEYGSAQPGQPKDVMYLTFFGHGRISLGHDVAKAIIYNSYREALDAMFKLYEKLVMSTDERMQEHYRKSLHIEKAS